MSRTAPHVPRRGSSGRSAAAVILAAVLATLALTAGCATSVYRRPTTRMTVDDFQAMTRAMAQSLLGSEAVESRGPHSPPWVVSIQKVTNLSSDVMTRAEQWSVMNQLVGATPIQALWRRKHIAFVLPARRVEQLRCDPNTPVFEHGFGVGRQPTHVMTATFRSITRAQSARRTDLYSTQFEIVNLRTGRSVWQDRFEYKRAAQGEIHD